MDFPKDTPFHELHEAADLENEQPQVRGKAPVFAKVKPDDFLSVNPHLCSWEKFQTGWAFGDKPRVNAVEGNVARGFVHAVPFQKRVKKPQIVKVAVHT